MPCRNLTDHSCVNMQMHLVLLRLKKQMLSKEITIDEGFTPFFLFRGDLISRLSAPSPVEIQVCSAQLKANQILLHLFDS